MPGEALMRGDGSRMREGRRFSWWAAERTTDQRRTIERRAGAREARKGKEMRLQKTCLPYMVVVAVVMSIYSIFLVHLTQSFRPSFGAEVRETAAEQAASKPQRLHNCKLRHLACVSCSSDKRTRASGGRCAKVFGE